MSHSPCPACTHHHCCRDYVVTITGSDMWRLARHFQIAPEQFLALCRVSEITRDCFTLGDDGQFRIALQKHGPNDTPLEQRWCAFWMTPLGEYGRCAAYDARPQACQVYPAFLDGGVVHLRADALCAPRSWTLANIDLERWQRALVLYGMEEDIYYAVVAAWNHAINVASASATASVYYAYLMAIYDRFDRVFSALDAAELDALSTSWTHWVSSGTLTLAENFVPEARWRDTLCSLRRIIADAWPVYG